MAQAINFRAHYSEGEPDLGAAEYARLPAAARSKAGSPKRVSYEAASGGSGRGRGSLRDGMQQQQRPSVPPPVTGGFSNADLKGTYVFSMSGEDGA